MSVSCEIWAFLSNASSLAVLSLSISRLSSSFRVFSLFNELCNLFNSDSEHSLTDTRATSQFSRFSRSLETSASHCARSFSFSCNDCSKSFNLFKISAFSFCLISIRLLVDFNSAASVSHSSVNVLIRVMRRCFSFSSSSNLASNSASLASAVLLSAPSSPACLLNRPTCVSNDAI
uniref:Uncharacterized protein n=1 Tax=Panstrongylus lignarius TaxID=156445 RepID=A0A224XM03_9HEMI